MVVDSISNLVNSLKTGASAGKETVTVPATKLVLAVLALLKKEEFIADFEVRGDKKKPDVAITMLYTDGIAAINGAKRISKSGKRVYRGARNTPSVRRGYGMAVVTTPSGIMRGDEARKKNVGGEVLFEIW